MKQTIPFDLKDRTIYRVAQLIDDEWRILSNSYTIAPELYFCTMGEHWTRDSAQKLIDDLIAFDYDKAFTQDDFKIILATTTYAEVQS